MATMAWGTVICLIYYESEEKYFKKNPKNYKILEKPKNNVKISFEIVFLTMWCHMAICCNLFLVPRGTYSTF